MSHSPEVLSLGFGKAGSQLHIGSWNANGYSVSAHDINPDRISADKMEEIAEKHNMQGRLKAVRNLKDVRKSPAAVDVATSSSHHIEAMEQFLEVMERNGLEPPKAWLIEKPVVSDEEEAKRLRSLLESAILEQSVFVNENYNASRGVEAVKAYVESEATRGNKLTGVDVVFYKNRVPDVLNGRFTDPTLGAFGIELPHQLAIAYNLAGVADGDNVTVDENKYLRDVHSVQHSEATYTQLRTEDGVAIRLAQGLGPFEMDAEGHMEDTDEPGIIRYATAHFEDGRSVRVKFDPVPGVERFHSVVEFQDEDGGVRELIVPDNTVQRVIGSVALYANTGQREPYTTGLSARNAINYSMSLLKLRREASEQ